MSVSRDALHASTPRGVGARGAPAAWGDSPCRAVAGLGEQPSPRLMPARAAPAVLEQRRMERGRLVGRDLLHVANEREGATTEKSAEHPSLLQRSPQGAPGLVPPPFCQGLLSDEIFQPSFPCFHPCRRPLPSRLPSPRQTHRCSAGLGVPLPSTHGLSPAGGSLNPLRKPGSVQRPAP